MASTTTDLIIFTLNGVTTHAKAGETLWQIAKRQGELLPHLCFSDRADYRADGNCRACMVEIEGERVLAASCLRQPTAGMVVHTHSQRARHARAMVMELLLSDQPQQSHDRGSHFEQMAKLNQVNSSRFAGREAIKTPMADNSHVAISVNLDACIQCNLCVRACREVQVNGVIGMANRGHFSQIVFDQGDRLADSSCVACGECVQVCPTGALMPSSLMDKQGGGSRHECDTQVSSVCPYCGVGCQVTLHVNDKQLAYVEGQQGPANRGRLCVKGRFGADYIHHPHRLRVPLIRRDGAPKGLNVDPANPMTHFREASWDEAIALVAEQMIALRQTHGGASVAGLGSAKCTNEEAYLFQKLIRQGFGHNNLDHCTRLCHSSSVAALLENLGSAAVTASFNEIEHADVAILIGCNPSENHPVAATFFKQFTQAGGQLIVMDPRGTAMKRFASQMLAFRAGTDVALLNAIMHVIVAEGLQDQAYIDKHTENWLDLKDHLRRFSPEKMAPLCGIDADQIRATARLFARAKAGMIFWGMGVSQHIHGTDNARCLVSLALMCGYVGRPGTGLHPLRGQNNVQGASDAGLIPMFLPDYQSVTEAAVRQRFDKLWSQGWPPNNSDDPQVRAAPPYPINPSPGLTVVEMMDAISQGQIQGMYIVGENPAMSDPNVEHARDALAKLSLLVVQDIFLTETASFADVILPAAAFAEKTGTVTNTNRQVQMGRRALMAPRTAREDWQIMMSIAKALGLQWNYTSAEAVFDEMTLVMDSLANISWQRLEQEHSVTYPVASLHESGQSLVFGDGFPRPSGRARFTPANMTAPAELPDTQYPLILTTGRQLEHWHTGAMTRRSAVLNELEPDANCSLHPATLHGLGINAGERIRLVSRRGQIELMVRADANVPESMVFVPFAYVEAAANILTHAALDPIAKIPEYKFAAVRAERLTVKP
ncbi:formate dehydrogenase subunit alpha [Shewanella sp. NIFS-20-20]|uniref:formate dehydrogenase subunit alpha n=1 Tax=Shewanella sp. NIFS-20-20 TaxID=2853806 RepID=UPI001C472C32|nr:formate dehydrogenase subunit alpha [Shewanella sp. NIFS-20-20]MBV7315099.1 formate dehydrogenase subunit alpha [Shewanella sp. NIFS-20-20]